MYEEICDKILREALAAQSNEGINLYEMAVAGWTEEYRVDGMMIWKEVLARLKEDGLLVCIPTHDNVFYKITDKGRVFVRTTSYVELRDERKLEKQKLLKELEEIEYQLKLHRWLLKTKWWPHILAIIAIIISLIALVNK